MMGSYRRRGYRECMCQYCAPSGSGARLYVKRLRTRNDRVQGKQQIREQLDDLMFGIDPD